MAIILTLWIGNGAVFKSSGLELLRTASSNKHFLLFPQCYQKTSFSGQFKVQTVW